MIIATYNTRETPFSLTTKQGLFKSNLVQFCKVQNVKDENFTKLLISYHSPKKVEN